MHIKKEKVATYISIFSILLFFVFLFFYCNIINSGYKLVDDHEIYYFSSIINKDNFLELLDRFLRSDGRFRPIYWVHRLSIFSFFKANFFLYYFEYFIFSILSSILLFKIINKFITAFPSLLIVAFVFLCCNFQIYLGLGYGELLSCTLLLLSIYFIISTNEKNRIIMDILSFIFLLLAIYSKETFLIAAPFVIILKILYKKRNLTIKESLKKNLIYVIFMFLFLILGLILNIIFDNSSGNYTIIFDFKEIINCLINILLSVKYIVYEYIIIFLFSVIAFFNLKQIQDKKEYFTYVMLGFLFLFSQLIFLSLFSKDNVFQERYLFPALFSGAILLTTIFSFVKNKLFEFILYLFLICSIFYNVNINPLQNVRLASNLNIEFNNTLEYTRTVLNENDTVLLIGDAIYTMEYFESLSRNYNYYNIKSVYFLPLIDKPTDKLNDFEKNLVNFFPQYYPNNIYNTSTKTPKIIIVFECPSKNDYMEKSNIDFSMYKKIPLEYYSLEFYEKK